MTAVDRRSNRCRKCGCTYTSKTHQTRCRGKSVHQYRAGLRAAYKRRKSNTMNAKFNRPLATGASDALTHPTPKAVDQPVAADQVAPGGVTTNVPARTL